MDGKELIEGTYKTYVDNAIVRKQGKKAPNKIVLIKDGVEISIGVWGKGTAEPDMPAGLIGLEKGKRVQIAITRNGDYLNYAGETHVLEGKAEFIPEKDVPLESFEARAERRVKEYFTVLEQVVSAAKNMEGEIKLEATSLKDISTSIMIDLGKAERVPRR